MLNKIKCILIVFIFQLCFSEDVKSKKQLKKQEKLAAKAMKKEQFKTANVSK